MSRPWSTRSSTTPSRKPSPSRRKGRSGRPGPRSDSEDVRIRWGDPGQARRAVEADQIALETLGIIGALVCDRSDDPIERVRLLKATVWVMVGRLLSAWSRDERGREWDEAKAMVIDVADHVREQREGKPRVQ